MNRELRDLAGALLWERLLRAEDRGDEAERERLEVQLLADAPQYRMRLKPMGRVSFASDPPGAQVFLFRYEAHGPLLVPVPHHPDRGRLLPDGVFPTPRLRIVREPPELVARLGFTLGDEVLRVAGEPIDVGGARCFRRLDEEAIDAEVEVRRQGEVQRIRVPGRIGERQEHPWLALGESCEAEAFPLVFAPDAVLGVTPTGAHRLEAGSYLAVLRREGCREVRLPFRVRREDSLELRVKLYRDEEIGAGFVFVPAGPAVLGGDPLAFYPEPARMVEIGDFFIQRYEVSVEEYFRFVNDPMVRAEIDAHPGGWKWSPILPGKPVGGAMEAICERDRDGRLRIAGYDSRERAQRWVSRQGAERYVRWLNEREEARDSGRRFALPSADEIEKAGRSADGRLFPWGSAYDPSLVSQYRAVVSPNFRNLDFATDSSPYDARNLAGSLCEWTRDDAEYLLDTRKRGRGEAFVTGGSYYDDLEPNFRLGGHTQERAREGSYRIGFRIVAYPAARTVAEAPAAPALRGEAPPEAGLRHAADPRAVPTWWADVNGDRKDDFCRLVGAPPPLGSGVEVRCLLSTGRGFGGEVFVRGADLGRRGSRWFADVNGDARADFCRLTEAASGSGLEIRALLGTGDGFSGEIASGPVEPGREGSR